MKKIFYQGVVALAAMILGVIIGYTLSNMSLKGVSLSYVGKGQEGLKQRDYMRAIAYFNRAIAADNNSFIAHLSLAEAYQVAGHNKLALEEYERIVRVLETEGREGPEIDRVKRKIEEIRKLEGN